MSSENKEALAHFGIKGQKWGIRRFQNEDGTRTEEGKKRERREKKEKPESATWKSKDARKLSDDELNRRNSRLQREQQYRQLTQSRKARAGKWIAKTASAVLVATAIGALKSKAVLGYKHGLESAGSYIKRMNHINLSNLR